MRRQTLGVWLVAVIALVACTCRLHAQDAVVVTVTNGTGAAAGRLVVSFTGSGGALTVAPLTVFAPTCPAASVVSGGGIVTIDWGANCVVAGASVSFLATTPNGPLNVSGGSWFGAGGAPLLGPIDTSPLAMYGTDGAELFSVDPATAATSPIGTVGAFGIVAAIDCAPDCVLYGGTGLGDGDLVTIDQTTAAETLVGNNGLPGEADSALEWVDSTLYAITSGFGGASTLVTLDPTTGAATTIGLTGLGPIGGIAYDRTTGIMYGTEAGATLTGNLVRIDLTTGAATIIGSTGFAAVTALEFHPTTGILYGGIGAIDASGGALVTIDLATGAATLVGPTPYTTLSGLTFCGGKVILTRLGPGGILLPNGTRVVWRQRIRYQPVGLFYGPWFKPPGQCWTRWCCFIGQICLRDVNVYVYKTLFGRVLGLRRCIPVVRNQFVGVRGAGWSQQRRTIPPPPDQPQIPIGGPIPNRPPLPVPVMPMNDANGATDQLTFSDDGGVSYRPGATMSQTFGAMLDDIVPMVPGSGSPPPLVINFIPTMQQLGPGFCSSANRLLRLINELQQIQTLEPDPWIGQVKIEIELLQLNLVSICNQMNSGAPIFDPTPYFNAANANGNLAGLMLGAPLPGDATPDSAQRLANAAAHFQRCALGWQTAGQQVAANMFDGINDTVERDTFYWHMIQHYPSELAMLSAALDRHARLRLSLSGTTGWGLEANEPIEIELVSLSLVSVAPIVVTTYEMPVSHQGDLYIRRPDRADGNIDADELFRVKVKFPTMLSRAVDVAPGDGRIIEVPPMILGDADGDNCITPDDLQLVMEQFGQGGEFAPEVPSSDVNFDGLVDFQDQLIVQQNMGLCGQAINDCDYNGQDDTIDLLNGDLTDCNGNSIPDECEVASGIAPDENENGVPDECDCPADLTGSGGPPPDGEVNVFDLFVLLANWNMDGPGADLAPPSNLIDVFDLFVMLDAWGPCK